ncbi:MAG: hypothetical protein ABIH34_04365 [Nanoarchaeota archaeon]
MAKRPFLGSAHHLSDSFFNSGISNGHMGLFANGFIIGLVIGMGAGFAVGMAAFQVREPMISREKKLVVAAIMITVALSLFLITLLFLTH